MRMTWIYLVGSSIILSGCMGSQMVQLISPQIPAELLETVPKPNRETKTLKDVGLLIADYDQALDNANSKISSTAKIVLAFEARVASAK